MNKAFTGLEWHGGIPIKWFMTKILFWGGVSLVISFNFSKFPSVFKFMFFIEYLYYILF